MPHKTKFIAFGSIAQRSKLDIDFPVNIFGKALYSRAVMINGSFIDETKYKYYWHQIINREGQIFVKYCLV